MSRLLQIELSFWLHAQQIALKPYQTMTSPHNMTAAVCTVALPLEMNPDNLNIAIKTKAITIAFITYHYAHFAGLSKGSRTSFYTSAHSVLLTGPRAPAFQMGTTSHTSPQDKAISNAIGLTQIKADSKPVLYGDNSAA